MSIRLNGSMISVAIVAAVVGAVVVRCSDVPAGHARRPDAAARPDCRTAEFQRHLAGQQRSALGSAGARRARRRRDAARRLSVRVRAGGGGPGGRARRGRRRAGVARRRAGRRRDPVHARGAGHQEGERRALDRPRSRAQVLSAGRPARDVHAVPVRDHAEHEQDSHGVRVRHHGADDPSGRRGPSPRRHVDGPLGRPVGGRHAGGGRLGTSTTRRGSTGRATSTATRCT